mmetsp:Transcript_10199/g.26591  ORF Transcript_10199/g.26591 Transcript_10199/m.26591 type:complete len:81 (+) Transcript_10199:1883-2125(+)
MSTRASSLGHVHLWEDHGNSHASIYSTQAACSRNRRMLPSYLPHLLTPPPQKTAFTSIMHLMFTPQCWCPSKNEQALHPF